MVAILLALLAAAGLVPGLLAPGRRVIVVDQSPSCDAASLTADVAFSDGSIEGALARAAADSDPDRIVLYTDAVFAHAPVADRPVDVVLRPRRDLIRVLSIRVPARVKPGADFVVEVDVGRTAGPQKTAREADLRLFRDGRRVGAEAYAVALRRGQKRTVRVRDRVARSGLVRYRATAGAGPPRESILSVGVEPVVLAIDDPQSGPRASIPGFVWVPRRAADVADTDLGKVDVILVAGALPSMRAQERVAQAVRGGTGLVVLSGQGFSGRPLETVLPLTDQPPGGRAAIVLLDCSGSMENLQPQMRRAIDALKRALSPTDRIAFLAFRSGVVAESAWGTVAASSFDMSVRATGNTNLTPALRRAAQLLAKVSTAHKRLFVISDGEWPDASTAAAVLADLGGVYRAALFLEEKRHPELFPTAFVAGDDLAGALRRLEEQAPDRRVPGPLVATKGNVARWVAGALPDAGPYANVERLFARGVGEQVALHANGIPLLATREPGGRVVMTPLPQLSDRNVSALLRSCARRGGAAELEAFRANGGIELRAASPKALPFFVGGVEVSPRPDGPGRWRAHAAADASTITVSFGEAVVLVPAQAHDELAGLTNRPDIAAEIARRSGGTLYRGGAVPSSERTTPAPFLLLLAAVACVLWSATRRRVS